MWITTCSTTENVYLLSYGNLKGKKIPEDIRTLRGEISEGKDCGISFSLAKAFENALIQTERKYDTILNAEVTHTTGMFPPLNCIKIKGFALNSDQIKTEEEK
ncbi:hypothetical protein EHQ76_04470 [Leptospira barantonii]|uniref:Uncharacterized protein n=1 Tax=Leptospira barantonii TaxID=2023184 RepID=A0A5F2BP39_9LEPT|nr:hypothetical protein [Leptospira barantonii]TGM07308.1 hypothetical protein EHQ76_04470 [Leptospira barantonii]